MRGKSIPLRPCACQRRYFISKMIALGFRDVAPDATTSTSATERPYDQYPSSQRFCIGARVRRRRGGGSHRSARARHAADQAAAGDRQEHAADRGSRHLGLRQGWPVLEMELAQDRRAFRHPFRCADPLDQRPRIQGRLDRHHPGEEFRRARLRDRLLGRKREEFRFPPDRRRRQSLGEDPWRHPGR